MASSQNTGSSARDHVPDDPTDLSGGSWLAAARRMNRSRERMTAVRSRPLAATPRARPRHARGSRAGAQLGGAQLGGAPRLVEAAHLAAARGPREVTDPPGPGSLDGQRRARVAGSL